MYFKQKYRRFIWAVSVGVAAAIFSLIIIQGLYRPQSPYIIPLNMTVNYAIVLCILVAIIPPAIVEYNNDRWLKQVDKNIPLFLMDVTESIRSGIPMLRALELASKRDYGPISKNLETAVVNFNLTSDLDGSLNWFGNSLIRPNGKRVSTILLEAYKSGGRMLDVLETSINMFTSIDEYRVEKESNVAPYVILVYVSSLIFLFIGWTIIAQFLTPLTTQKAISSTTNINIKALDISYYKSIIFWAAIVEGLLGGLVAGKITSSKIFSGLIHSVLLIVITIVFYSLFLS